MTNRRNIIASLSIGTTAILTGCGTVLYPDRAHQKDRGSLDPAVVILDGIGLFFFLIPGLVAFAVDFTTGAIYFPEGHEPGDRERTIFDRYDAKARPNRTEIERVVSIKTGRHIALETQDVRVMPLQGIDQFWKAHAQLA